jgi:hypothetical protein
MKERTGHDADRVRSTPHDRASEDSEGKALNGIRKATIRSADFYEPSTKFASGSSWITSASWLRCVSM